MTIHTVHAQPLKDYLTALIMRMGADTEATEEVAAHLVRANLSGHDSHGVIRIPQYLNQIDQGELLPAARPAVLADSGRGALIDAKRGFGQFSTEYARDWAVRRAHEQGLATVAIRHSMHIGRLGEYIERIVADGMIGILTAGAVGEDVGPLGLPGARGRFFGTNPWSIGFPGNDRPVIFDGSTSTVAEGKVRLARDTGRQLPPGCLTDRDGNATQNPADLYAGGALLPLGGEVAGHKGYGFALAAALLGGLAMIDDLEPTLLGTSIAKEGDPAGRVAGVFLLVIDPGMFSPGDGYRNLVDKAAAGLKRASTVSATSVLLPGEPESSIRAQHLEEGIPLAEETWQQLLETGNRFGVKPIESGLL